MAKTTFEYLRERLHAQAGLVDAPKKFATRSFESLLQSEWSPEFEQLMRNRMAMGALRYGNLAWKARQHVKFNLLGAVKSKIEHYERTGNTEYLVDIANYCLIAFMCDDHPLRHFKALDDHHDHCKTK